MKATAVIPAYNEEKYIGKCIQSLLQQSYKNLEIIIVDDGSTDNTPRIVKAFAAKNKRVRLLRQQHLGPGRARNLGVKHAKGGIIILVDSDMEFDKDYVKNLIEPILAKKTVGTFHMQEYCVNKNNIWARCWGTKRVTPEKYGSTANIFRAILKSYFLKAGGFDPKLGTFDDRTLSEKLGIKSIGVKNAVCYHNNPTTLHETFIQYRWIGRSYAKNIRGIKDQLARAWHYATVVVIFFAAVIAFAKQKVAVYLIAAAVIALLLQSLKRMLAEKDAALFFALPIFYTVKILALLLGFSTQLLSSKQVVK